MTADSDRRPPLDATQLTSEVPAWLRVEAVAETGSTNADVSARARAGEREGLVLVAEAQSAGRGRLDRSWVSPARAGLTFSVLLTPGDIPAERWGWLPLLSGLAVVEALTELGVPDAAVKWPNDVLVGGRKLAGILSERVEAPDGPVAVVGIGLNVSTTAEELPVPEATSLAVAGHTPSRDVVLGATLRVLAGRYAVWRAAGGVDEALRGAYQARCATVGTAVEVALPGGGVLSGEGIGIEPDGALLVRASSGPTVVHAGDVVHVRGGRVAGDPDAP